MDIDLNEIKVESEWPLIARIKDDLFPYEGYDHIRYTARALAENEEGKFGFLHIVGEDYFGVRDHLETCGGGMEENEGVFDTLQREIMEEMGFKTKGMKIVGSILDAYNLLKRVTYSSFAHAYVDTKENFALERTEAEQILIQEIVWLPPEEALYRVEHIYSSRVDLIVQRRDAAALRYYLEHR